MASEIEEWYRDNILDGMTRDELVWKNLLDEGEEIRALASRHDFRLAKSETMWVIIFSCACGMRIVQEIDYCSHIVETRIEAPGQEGPLGLDEALARPCQAPKVKE